MCLLATGSACFYLAQHYSGFSQVIQRASCRSFIRLIDISIVLDTRTSQERIHPPYYLRQCLLLLPKAFVVDSKDRNRVSRATDKCILHERCDDSAGCDSQDPSHLFHKGPKKQRIRAVQYRPCRRLDLSCNLILTKVNMTNGTSRVVSPFFITFPICSTDECLFDDILAINGFFHALLLHSVKP